MRPNAEFIKDFVDEALSHISAVEDFLLYLEQGDFSDEAVNGIFRAVHSIKGAAGLFEFSRITELAHAMETLFDAIRKKSVLPDTEIIDAALAATDLLKELINHFEESDNYDIGDHVHNMNALLNGQKAVAEDQAENLWDLWDELTTVKSQPAEATVDVRETVPSSEAAPLETALPVALPDGSCAEREKGRVQNTKEESVRVPIGVLNDLLTLAGEMVIRRNQLLRLLENGAERTEDFQTVAKGIDVATTALQEKVMKARMQPVGSLFNRFPRIVRELSRRLGKEMDLQIEGTQVELDKSIIEVLVDPLTHIIRNAIDHGIESSIARERQNKPFFGTIFIRAYHEAGRVTIEIEDDGAGIDPGKVAEKAVQKGFVTERQAASMSEREILQLIMRPGFSSADNVTELSGRGVGMDVVKTNIEKLNGKIDIVSQVGKGTIFRLALPLTLAIIPALIVESGEFTAAIPQVNLNELVLIQPDDDKRSIDLIQGHPVLRMRDRLIPLFRLADIIDDTDKRWQDREVYFRAASREVKIVVLKCGSQVFALEVDRIYDHEEILVKPLPPSLKRCNYYMGSTVLGDGRIAMILDPEEIKLQAGLQFLEGNLPITPAVAVLEEEQELLLFAAPGGEWLGIDITLISRVQQYEENEIQKIRSKEYVIFQGKPLRIIRPEYYLPISRAKKRAGLMHVIVPKLVKNPIGIVAAELHDIVKTVIRLNDEGPSGPGLIGSTLIDGRIVLLPNMYELFEQAAPDLHIGKTDVNRGQNNAAAEGSGEKATVLLVEDMPFFAKVTKGYLEGDSLDVILAANGQEAIAILGREKIDLVVSDIEMPVMNGFELIRFIRADDKLKSLPVIALTSLTGELQREKGLRAGFSAYEFKLDRVRLLSTIHQFLPRGNR